MKGNRNALIGVSKDLPSIFNTANLSSPGDSLKFSITKDGNRLAKLCNQNGKFSLRQHPSGTIFGTFSIKS